MNQYLDKIKLTLTFDTINDRKRVLQWSPVRPGNVNAIRAHSTKSYILAHFIFKIHVKPSLGIK